MNVISQKTKNKDMKSSHVIVGIITFLLCIFCIEPAIVSWFVNLLPASANDWKPILKVIAWIFVFCGGFCLYVWISIIVGGVIGSLFNKD